MFLGALADGQRRAGVTDDALATIGAALDWCDGRGERWCMAELLRIKAEIVAEDASWAERLLRESLDWAGSRVRCRGSCGPPLVLCDCSGDTVATRLGQRRCWRRFMRASARDFPQLI